MVSLVTDAVVKKDIVYPDQDLLNLIYRDKVKTLDTVWNYQTSLKNDLEIAVSRSEMRQVKIYHYVSKIKPWHAEYVRWLVFGYWMHLRKFLTASERREYWRRKKFMRGQLKRVLRKCCGATARV